MLWFYNVNDDKSYTFSYSALTSKHFENHGLNGGLVSQKLILYI